VDLVQVTDGTTGEMAFFRFPCEGSSRCGDQFVAKILKKYSLVVYLHRNILGHRLLRICGQAAIPPPPPPPWNFFNNVSVPAAATEAPQGWGWGTRWVEGRVIAPPGPPGPPGAPVSCVNARERECERRILAYERAEEDT
jgi:hypothetical protein